MKYYKQPSTNCLIVTDNVSIEKAFVDGKYYELIEPKYIQNYEYLTSVYYNNKYEIIMESTKNPYFKENVIDFIEEKRKRNRRYGLG